MSDTTIAENIAFGVLKDQIDVSRMKSCAERAQIAGFIESCPKGYETYVGEQGLRLSGGQRQRIGIARALYKQADILVLDEATSALDLKTEGHVMKSIDEKSCGYTILIIAHRLSTISSCDRVIELSNNGPRVLEAAEIDAMINNSI